MPITPSSSRTVDRSSHRAEDGLQSNKLCSRCAAIDFSAPFASAPPATAPMKSISQFSNSILPFPLTTSPSTPSTHKILAAPKKKYKPVALKTRPVLGAVPEQFRILRDIKGDPLSIMPTLSTDPPPFKPTGRYTLERFETTEQLHDGDFLLPDERRVLHHFMCLHNEAFAWTDDERGCFKPEYFPPCRFPRCSSHALGAEEYPHSARDLQRSLRGDHAKDRRRSLRAIELVVSIAVVLCRQEGR